MDGVIGREGFENSLGGDVVISVGAAQNEALNIPGGDVYLSADFIRTGYDLTLKVDGAQTIVIPDYFMNDMAPDLLLDTGAVVSGALATKLAGPMAAGQYAQLQAGPGGVGAAIGSVTDLNGSVQATRADGTQVTLGAGDSVYQGDVIETGAKSSIGVVFADDTTFSLDAGGRMVLDEMVYDPDAQTGVFEATVVQGVFSFVSGQVAKVGPDSMVLHTPKTTIGIRGSTGLVKSGVNGGEDLITLVPDIDGNLGELIVSNQGGFMVLNQPNASTTVFSAFQPPSPVVFMSPQEVQQNFGGALTVLVRTEAKKAVVKAGQAAQKADEAEQQAAQQQEEAAAAEEEAAQADEAAADAEAEAEAAAAEAEAAKAEAEAAVDPEAKAEAEAKVAEAEAKLAAAEAKAATQSEAAATKAAEAATKAAAAQEAAQQAEDAVAAQQQAQQFSQMAGQAAEVQQQVFTQLVESGVINADPTQQGPGPAQGDVSKGMIYISANGDAMTVTGEGEVIIVNPDGTTSTGNVAELAATIAEDIMDTIDEQIDGGIPAETTFVSDTGTLTVTTDENYVETDFSETLTAVNGGGTLAGGAGSTNFYFPWASLKGGSGGTYTITDAGGTNQISFDGMDVVYFDVEAYSSTSGFISIYNDHTAANNSFGTVSYSGISQFLLSDVTVTSFSTTNFTTSASGDVVKLSALQAGQHGYGMAGDANANTFTVSAGDFIAFGKGGDDIFNLNTTGSGDVLGGTGADTFRIYKTGNHLNLKGGGDSSADTFDYSTMSTPASLYVYMYSTNTLVQDVVLNSTTSYVHGLDYDSTDVFTGSSANDFIHVYSGSFGTINGNGGNDTFTVNTGATVTALNGTSGNNTYTLTTGATVTTLTGGSGNDNITVNSSATATNVSGGQGTNTLTVLQGGSIGGYTGGTGDDTVVMDSALLANAITIDGAGQATNDNITIKAYAGASVNLNTKTATLTNFETTTVTGTDSTSGVTLVGYSGTATTLDGSGYSDTLTGGSGNDTIQGQHSADTLTGGTGSDTFVYYSTSDAGDTLQDFNGATNFAGSAGESDKLAFSTSGLSLSSIVYEEIAWNGSSTGLTLTNAAANVVVLTGGTAGTYANALTALASGNATATNAVFIFNDSDNSTSGTGTVAYTTDMAGGAGTNVSLATFNGVTSDMVHLAAGDFAVV